MSQWLHTRVARKEDPRDLNSFENSRSGAMDSLPLPIHRRRVWRPVAKKGVKS